MLRTMLVLIACAMPLSGCALVPRQAALPDPRIPHRVASPATVEVWVRIGDELKKERVRIDPGWYVAGPMVVDR